VSKIEYCPRCTSPISGPKDFCPCGWVGTENEQNTSNRSNQDRKDLCAWEGSGKECPALGVHTLNTRGSSKWYCHKHLNQQGLTEGLKIIDDYEQNGLPSKISNAQKIIRNTMKMGLGLKKNDDESDVDFKRRIVAQKDNFFKQVGG